MKSFRVARVSFYSFRPLVDAEYLIASEKGLD